jgi:hypothetical protein
MGSLQEKATESDGSFSFDCFAILIEMGRKSYSKTRGFFADTDLGFDLDFVSFFQRHGDSPGDFGFDLDFCLADLYLSFSLWSDLFQILDTDFDHDSSPGFPLDISHDFCLSPYLDLDPYLYLCRRLCFYLCLCPDLCLLGALFATLALFQDLLLFFEQRISQSPLRLV